MSVRTPSQVSSVVLAVIVVLAVAGPALAISPLLGVFGCAAVAILWLELLGRPARNAWIRLTLVAVGAAFFLTLDPQIGAAGLGCAGLVVTLAVRDRNLCLGLVPAISALTLAVEPGRLVTVLAVLAAVAAFGGGMLLRRIDPGTATRARADHPHRPLRSALRSAVWPTAGVLALTIGIFLLLPQPESLVRQSLGGAGFANNAAAGSTRSMGGYVGGPMSLNNRGALPTTPIFSVQDDSPRLWRVSVLDSYDGTGWQPYSGAWAQRLWAPSGQDQSYQVHPLAGFRGEVPAPGALVTISTDAQRDSAFSTFAYSANDFTVTAGPYAEASGTGAGVGSGDAVDDPSDPRWTALPGTVTDRTRDLARELAAGSSDPVRVSAAIQNYLTSGEFGYDLNAPTAPPGRDNVDYLLFDSRAGFCEHYASAEVVLLRSLGIPARMAVGYSGGTSADGTRTVTAAQAHAWVEVYVAGRGWVTSDPTPADQGSLWSLLSGRWVEQVIGGLLILLAAVGLLWWLRRSRRPDAGRRVLGRPQQPAELALRQLMSAMTVAGIPVRQSQTFADVIGLLPQLSIELRVLERHFYGPATVPYPELQAAIAGVERTTASLLSLAGNRAQARAR